MRRATSPPGDHVSRRDVRLPAVVAVVAVLMLYGCGREDPADNAVEAREQNTAELAGVAYRVSLFRELNVSSPPDDAVWEGSPPERGTGLYLLVLRACAAADGTARASDRIHLEDAFGKRFAPRFRETTDAFAYTPTTLEPGECLPAADTAAEETFGGAALVFEVPFESTDARPLVLQIGSPEGREKVRIQLDL